VVPQDTDFSEVTMRRKSIYLGLLALIGLSFLISSAMAQSVDTLEIVSESQIVRRIVESNLQLSVVEYQTLQLFERSKQVGTLPDPTVGITSFPYPVFTAEGSQRAQFQFTQAIPYPGKLALRSEAKEWEARASESSEETIKEKLILDGLTELSEIKMLIRQRLLIFRYRKVLRDFESVADTRYRVGTGTQQAVLKAQLERNALDARESDLSQKIKAKKRKLAILVDGPVSISSSVEWEWRHDLRTLSIGLSEETALLNRPEIDVLEAMNNHASSLTSLAKKDWRPDFKFGVTYFNIGDQAFPPQASGRDALAMMVGVTLPIQRGRLKSRLEETHIRQSEIRAQTWWTQRSIREEFRHVLETITLLIEQRDLYERALLPQAETTLQSTISAYTTGEVGFLDLLDAQRMVFDLSWQFEDVSARLEKALYSFEKATGTIRSRHYADL